MWLYDPNRPRTHIFHIRSRSCFRCPPCRAVASRSVPVRVTLAEWLMAISRVSTTATDGSEVDTVPEAGVGKHQKWHLEP